MKKVNCERLRLLLADYHDAARAYRRAMDIISDPFYCGQPPVDDEDFTRILIVADELAQAVEHVITDENNR